MTKLANVLYTYQNILSHRHMIWSVILWANEKKGKEESTRAWKRTRDNHRNPSVRFFSFYDNNEKRYISINKESVRYETKRNETNEQTKKKK